MKSLRVLLAVSILLGVNFASAQTRKATATSSASTSMPLTPPYVNKEKGFTMSFPKGWEQKEGVMGSTIIAVSPSNGKKEKFRENINVVVEKLPQRMTTKTYYTESLKVLKKLFTDFKLEKSGHNPADRMVASEKTEIYWSVFSHRMGKIHARVLQYMTVKGTQAFVITCSAAPDTFEKLRPSFEAAVRTFRAN